MVRGRRKPETWHGEREREKRRTAVRDNTFIFNMQEKNVHYSEGGQEAPARPSAKSRLLVRRSEGRVTER